LDFVRQIAFTYSAQSLAAYLSRGDKHLVGIFDWSGTWEVSLVDIVTIGKSMKLRIFLLFFSVVISLFMIIYGAFYSTYKVYDPPVAQNVVQAFYDWFTETEVIVGTTFEGIQRTSEGRLFTLKSYHAQLKQKGWKYCPS